PGLNEFPEPPTASSAAPALPVRALQTRRTPPPLPPPAPSPLPESLLVAPPFAEIVPFTVIVPDATIRMAPPPPPPAFEPPVCPAPPEPPISGTRSGVP